MSYLDRTKRLQDPDSATNMEYLKNCIYRFMATTENSERRRLYPVISTILKLTSSEKTAIEVALATAEEADPSNVVSSLSASISSFFG